VRKMLVEERREWEEASKEEEADTVEEWRQGREDGRWKRGDGRVTRLVTAGHQRPSASIECETPQAITKFQLEQKNITERVGECERAGVQESERAKG